MPKKYLPKEDLHMFAARPDADKYIQYEVVVDKYNILIDAFNEVENKLRASQKDVDNWIHTTDIINAAFRRIGASERIDYLSEVGTIVANFLWKQRCLSDIPLVLDVKPTEETPEETT